MQTNPRIQKLEQLLIALTSPQEPPPPIRRAVARIERQRVVKLTKELAIAKREAVEMEDLITRVAMLAGEIGRIRTAAKTVSEDPALQRCVTKLNRAMATFIPDWDIVVRLFRGVTRMWLDLHALDVTSATVIQARLGRIEYVVRDDTMGVLLSVHDQLSKPPESTL